MRRRRRGPGFSRGFSLTTLLSTEGRYVYFIPAVDVRALRGFVSASLSRGCVFDYLGGRGFPHITPHRLFRQGSILTKEPLNQSNSLNLFRMIRKLRAQGISTSHSGTGTVMRRSERTRTNRSLGKRTNLRNPDGEADGGEIPKVKAVMTMMMRTMRRRRRRPQ